VSKGQPDLQALQVKLVSKGQREELEQPDLPVLMVRQVQLDQPVKPAHKDQRALLDQRETQGYKVQQVKPVLLVFKVPPAPPDQLVKLVLMVQPALQVPQESKGQLE
jgi:hypothetical protein